MKSSLYALEEIHVSEPKRWVHGQGHLAIVEDYPLAVLANMADVVTARRVGAHV